MLIHRNSFEPKFVLLVHLIDKALEDLIKTLISEYEN